MKAKTKKTKTKLPPIKAHAVRVQGMLGNRVTVCDRCNFLGYYTVKKRGQICPRHGKLY